MNSDDADTYSFSQTAKNIKRILSEMYRSNPLILILWMVLLFLATFIPALQIWLQKMSIDLLVVLPNNNLLFGKIMLLMIAYYLLFLLSNIITQFQGYFSFLKKEEIEYLFRREFAQKIINMPLFYLENSEYNKRVVLTQQSISRSGVSVINHIMTLGSVVLSVGNIFLVLYMTHWSLPIALLISSLPGILFLIVTQRRMTNRGINQIPITQEKDYVYRLLTNKEYSKEIRLFDLGEYFLNKWRLLFFQNQEYLKKDKVLKSFGAILISFVNIVTSLIIAFFFLFKIGDGVLTVGDYVALTGAVTGVQGMLGIFGHTISQYIDATMYMNKYFNFMDHYGIENKSNHTYTSFPSKAFNEIKVNCVTFHYPEQDQKILDNISFTIKAGERIAIVGQNGAGKSTLVNCLLGLYEASSGTILFGNTDIRNIKSESLRNHVTAVFQDFIKYNYTLRENIGFGRIKDMSNDQRIMTQLQKVGLNKLLETRNITLDTILGSQIRKGKDLSGGQWQKIAIARAFMSDAEFVVLDEPTSALDPISELEIFGCFLEMAQDKTIIMISHRLGPARFADRILVLKDGRIIEEGKHDDLLERGGEYAKMYSLQAKWYKEDSNLLSLTN